MAWRVTETEVRELIDSDLEISVAPFIGTANALTNYVVSQDANGVLNTELKKEIEKYLAAHFYEHRDQAFAAKKTGDSSATFQGVWGKGFESSKWGQTAITLDVTGVLRALSKNAPIKITWLGKPPSDQIDYVDRD